MRCRQHRSGQNRYQSSERRERFAQPATCIGCKRRTERRAPGRDRSRQEPAVKRGARDDGRPRVRGLMNRGARPRCGTRGALQRDRGQYLGRVVCGRRRRARSRTASRNGTHRISTRRRSGARRRTGARRWSGARRRSRRGCFGFRFGDAGSVAARARAQQREEARVDRRRFRERGKRRSDGVERDRGDGERRGEDARSP